MSYTVIHGKVVHTRKAIIRGGWRRDSAPITPPPEQDVKGVPRTVTACQNPELSATANQRSGIAAKAAPR